MAIKIEPEKEFLFERARIDEEEKKEKLKIKIDTSNVNLNDLMGRIRNHVLIKRIRVNLTLNLIIHHLLYLNR